MTCGSKNGVTPIIAAAKVGGIQSNIEYGAEFLYRNLTIGTNLIHGAHLAGVKRLIYLSSNCVYPIDSLFPLMRSAC